MAGDEKKGEKTNGGAMYLSEDQFERLMAKIGQGPQPTAAQLGPLVTDESIQANLSELRDSSGRRKPHRIEMVPCTSAETTATFTAVVETSAAHQKGRVLALENYEYPAGVEVKSSEGGLCPDGLEIKHKNTGELTKQFKQWRWVTFYQADLKRYVGMNADLLRRLDGIAQAQTASGPR